MRRALRHGAAIATTLVLLMGSVSAGSIVAQEEQGTKARILVGDFTSSADDCTSGMTAAIADMLASALANADKFVVLSDQGTLGSTGVVVNAVIKKFDAEAGGGRLGGLRRRALGAAGVEEKTAEIEMGLRLVDAGTGRVLESGDVEAKSTNWGPDVTGGSWVQDVVLSGALSEYEGEPMEDAIRSVLVEAIDMIEDEVPDEYFRFTGKEHLPGAAGGAAAGDPVADEASEIAEDMTLYTRYDFVPGNKVIFYDDMSDEEEGEFPYRWNLERGVYEVVRLGGEFWIMATDDGYIRPKTPDAPLPPKYTVEMEFYNHGPEYTGNYFYIIWLDEAGQNIGSFGVYSNDNSWLTIDNNTLADKALAEPLTKGIHTLRIMATSRSIKGYVDEERVANVPQVEGFNPVGFQLRHRPYREAENPTLFRGFRFAEGGKTMREQLDDAGKIVTHGILFDSDSYTIKGESYRTLSEIGQLLQDDPDLRLSIDGHTDSDGSDEHNLALSESRANSVRDYLIATYSITPERLEAKGLGESQPMDTNDTPEGKANNRRVELVRL